MKSKHIWVIKCFCPSITIVHSEKIDHLQKQIEKAFFLASTNPLLSKMSDTSPW